MWGRSAAGDGDGEWVGGGAARRGEAVEIWIRRGEARQGGFRAFGVGKEGGDRDRD
jgi:hypothetical protein